MSTQIYRPAEVAELLDISTSTLRRWSQQYRRFLSVAAGKQGHTQELASKHRRYSRADVQLLAQVQTLVQNGLSHAEVQQRLSIGQGSSPNETDEKESMAEVTPDPADTLALSPLPETSLVNTDATQLLTGTLDLLADSQQMLLSGQHTERQLLGVLLQDNFNLKEENSRLRERMLEAERKLYELKREIDGERTVERERMRLMEASLFELQRRLDSMSNQMVTRTPPPFPAQPAPTSSIPPAAPDSPSPTPSSLPEESLPEEKQAESKPGFWARLFGK